MSQSQRETPVLAELCTLLVKDVYGELAARLHSILARHGRQTLAAIARASYLNPRQVKYGLVILLQQQLIFHYTNNVSVTYYEIDWQSSYALVRMGKVARLVQDRFGKKAANVISNLLALGHTRIVDLKEAYFPEDALSDDESEDGAINGLNLKRKRSSGVQSNRTVKTNGIVHPGLSHLDGTTLRSISHTTGNHSANAEGKFANTHDKSYVKNDFDSEDTSAVDDDRIVSEQELFEILSKLIGHGWVRTATGTQYLSPGDMHDILEKEAIELHNAGNIPTGTKDKEKVRQCTLGLQRDMREAWRALPQPLQNGHMENYSFTAQNKRVKTNGVGGKTHMSSAMLDDKIVVRVNPEKIAVAMRTEQLVQLVDQRLGHTTGCVYRTMLQQLEFHLHRCYDEWTESQLTEDPINGRNVDPNLIVNARDVAHRIDRNVDICDGLEPNVVVQLARKGHVRSTFSLSQPVDSSKLTFDDRARLLEKHIQLLSEDPFHFVTWHSRSQWHVEFDKIAKQMLQTEINNTVFARHGALGTKLIRTLRKKGKLDERATCNALKMPASDIRGLVNDLTVQGFAQTQELPKVDRREAKHSIHLVWYDRQRAREKLLHDTYKGMVRTLQRIAFEKEMVQPVLSKAERSDVIGNEEKWLNKGELDALKRWKEVQDKLLLQLFREDDLVAMLRDFHGPLSSV